MRINCVPVGWLADQHLMAEFREIKMLPKALLRSINSKKGLDTSRISRTYTLNAGHGYFFYNKLGYVYSRYEEVFYELLERGYNINDTDITDVKRADLSGSWNPSSKEVATSLARIEQKIMMKPEWYRYKRNKMTQEDWELFFTTRRKTL
jgi:deoxyribonuclease (pyrimidine dimer)